MIQNQYNTINNRETKLDLLSVVDNPDYLRLMALKDAGYFHKYQTQQALENAVRNREISKDVYADVARFRGWSTGNTVRSMTPEQALTAYKEGRISKEELAEIRNNY